MFLSASSRHREHEKSLNNSLLMYIKASVIQSMKQWSIHSEIRDGLWANWTRLAAIREAMLSGRFCGFIDLGYCNHPPSDVAGWGRIRELLRWSVGQLGDNSAKVATIHHFKGLHLQRMSELVLPSFLQKSPAKLCMRMMKADDEAPVCWLTFHTLLRRSQESWTLWRTLWKMWTIL